MLLCLGLILRLKESENIHLCNYVDVGVTESTNAEILFRTSDKCITNAPGWHFLHVILTLKWWHARLFLLMLCVVASIQIVPVFYL